MHAEYLGTTIPDGMQATAGCDAQVTVTGRGIQVTSSAMANCRLYTTGGHHIATQSGTQVTLQMPARGTYLLYVDNGESAFTRKIVTD